MLETKGSKVRYTDVVKERRSQDMGEGKAHESDHKFPLCKICHFTQGNADEDEVEGGEMSQQQFEDLHLGDIF